MFAATAVLTPPLHVGLRRWFPDTAAHFLTELNVIHPFREGNGRTMRVFAELWAASVGLRLAWDNVEPEQIVDATIHGVTGDDSQLREALDRCIEDCW